MDKKKESLIIYKNKEIERLIMDLSKQSELENECIEQKVLIDEMSQKIAEHTENKQILENIIQQQEDEIQNIKEELNAKIQRLLVYITQQQNNQNFGYYQGFGG